MFVLIPWLARREFRSQPSRTRSSHVRKFQNAAGSPHCASPRSSHCFASTHISLINLSSQAKRARRVKGPPTESQCGHRVHMPKRFQRNSSLVTLDTMTGLHANGRLVSSTRPLSMKRSSRQMKANPRYSTCIGPSDNPTWIFFAPARRVIL
jgi:hypothetical protein